MAIIKDVTVKINNGTATLDAPVQFYEKDHDVELRFRLMDYKYKYDKDPQNILNSVDEDVLEAYTTIVNPRGYELEQINGVVKNDIVIFRLDPTYTDELDELGTYKLQIHIKCTHSEFTIPPITFEVLQRLKGIKVVTDGEDEVDNSEILDNSSKFVSDETGKLIIEWKKGDMISSAKLNAMVDVINDAVDEEKIRQENEIEREKKANNKIQELENTRVEYVNKFDDELDSFADQADTTMSDYETRFNALTVSQQQDAEVIDARDGEQTLRARLDRDIQKPSIIYEEVEGSYITVDTTCGYAQNVEILGNTIQNQNDLADIRSVGDKVENQELYEIPVLIRGKNLNKSQEFGRGINPDGSYNSTGENNVTDYCNVKENTNYTISINGVLRSVNQFYYDKDKKFISKSETPGSKFTTPQGAKYARFTFGFTQEGLIQLEEGTVATPYEPYVEDKLTILSPVQLEKVGDVADRIICKDGVWGVEKNISTTVFDGSEGWRYHSTKDNTSFFQLSISSSIYRLPKNDNTKANILSNRFLNTIPNIGYNNDIEGIYLDTRTNLSVRLLNTKLNTQDLAGFKSWLSENSILLKYQLAQPTFIPLPHDQQIKLRTFANKTNISFGCEIEPTLKASVSKSIGATVNSHTEQIDNLGKEIDKIKKLEESTTSTVTTESDFTTVTETSNGYFEDVKLEGRTLVNLMPNQIFSKTAGVSKSWIGEYFTLTQPTKANAEYTVIVNIISNIAKVEKIYFGGKGKSFKDMRAIYISSSNYYCTKAISSDETCDHSQFFFQFEDIYSSGDFSCEILLLEGDHTQNPPEFFEGLKSVGEDVDEISVLSRNENLLNLTGGFDVIPRDTNISTVRIDNDSIIIKSSDWVDYYGHKINVKKGKLYYSFDLTYSVLVYITNSNGEVLKQIINDNKTEFRTLKGSLEIEKDCELTFTYRYRAADNSEGIVRKAHVSQSIQNYKLSKQDKKRILYYNPTTNTWEKPILRQWDSIEKHADGKYYYHKRSEEVIFNGSENWIDRSTAYVSDTQTRFSIEHSVKPCSIGAISLICDKYPVVGAIPAVTSVYENGINHHITGSTIYITVPKTTLANFIHSLQANPVTVVYQLAEEKVYECTDLDLITYADETNLMVKGGAIVPKTTLNVHQNIANIATILQEKVNVLENEIFVDGKISKELEKINNLEESVTSEVVSESDFTTVAETSNGYFEDVKLEGRTFVNMLKPTSYMLGVGELTEEDYTLSNSRNYLKYVKNNTNKTPKWLYISCGKLPFDMLKPNTKYTIKLDKCVGILSVEFKRNDGIKSISDIGVFDANGCAVVTTKSELVDADQMLYLNVKSFMLSEVEVSNVILLEGDHTQNPPSFFEGLKSVGQDVDEISVLSCNENLFNVDDVVSDSPLFYKCNEYIQYPASGEATILKDDFEHDTVYTFTFKASSNRSGDTIIINFVCEYTDGTSEIFSIGRIKPNTVSMGTFTSTRGKTIKCLKNSFNALELITLYLDGTSIIKGEQSKPYQPHKQDKKRILYYNDETQTWEKPILRQWDSIEKHSDGKYYYHKRTSEVKLTGSESWNIASEFTDTIRFYYNPTQKHKPAGLCISDKFNLGVAEFTNVEGVLLGNSYGINIEINKSKLTTSQDVQGFKTWLQTNNVTVVYQLAEEKVYECTNLDLITYADETNFIVNTGAITPKSTLKVMCNITNVVRELQQKVSNLENYIQHVMIDALNNALNE